MQYIQPPPLNPGSEIFFRQGCNLIKIGVVIGYKYTAVV